MTINDTAKWAGVTAAALMLAGSSVAFAQTYDSSTATDGSSTATGTAGVPNTGAGGNATTNAVILVSSALAAAAAGAYLMRNRLALRS